MHAKPHAKLGADRSADQGTNAGPKHIALEEPDAVAEYFAERAAVAIAQRESVVVADTCERLLSARTVRGLLPRLRVARERVLSNE